MLILKLVLSKIPGFNYLLKKRALVKAVIIWPKRVDRNHCIVTHDVINSSFEQRKSVKPTFTFLLFLFNLAWNGFSIFFWWASVNFNGRYMGAMKHGRGMCSTLKVINLTYLHVVRAGMVYITIWYVPIYRLTLHMHVPKYLLALHDFRPVFNSPRYIGG